MEKIIVSCPGSCGELIQGYIDDELRLVSCGINVFSYVSVSKGNNDNSNSELKARKAIGLTEEAINVSSAEQLNLGLLVKSNLSIAKGMASSTADIAATSLATSLVYGHPLLPTEIAKICTQIESTDSVMFDSMTLFSSKSGKYVQETGWQPDFNVLVLEPETILETEIFHTRKNDDVFKQQAKSFSRVHRLYLSAVKEKSLEKLGEAATLSAKLNQAILPKPFFEEVVSMKNDYQSIFGVNVAHSGTVMGILLRDLTEMDNIIKELVKRDITSIYSKLTVYNSCFEGVKQQKGWLE